MSRRIFRTLFLFLLICLSFTFFTCGDGDDNATDDDATDDDATDDDSIDDDTMDDDDTDDDDDDTGPSDVYVSVNGDDAYPGTMAAPKRTISAGVTLAASGGTVYVAAGTYAESVTISGVSLLGGYEDVGWTRDIAANQTIIAGVVDEAALTVTGADTKDAVEVSGFSIQGNSSTTDAFGVKIVDGANVTFTDNTVTVLQAEAWSYGLYIADSASTLENNDINGNSGTPLSRYSTACYATNSTLEIENNTIYGGQSSQDSDALRLFFDVDVVIQNNVIDGGDPVGVFPESRGVWISNAISAIVVNNEIFGGVSEGSDGIIINSDHVDVINNMIHGGDGSYGSDGIVIHQLCHSVNIVHNSIYAGTGERTSTIISLITSGINEDNTLLIDNILHAGAGTIQSDCLDFEHEADEYRQATMINNDFYDPDGDCLILDHGVCIDDIAEVNACEYLGCVEASGNISADPLWVSADDFHLTAGSLCIDAGIDPAPWYAGDLVDYDFDGDPRPSGSGWDIGADEFTARF